MNWRQCSVGAVALLLLLPVIAVPFAGEPAESEASQTVRLIIDYNTGVEKHFLLVWQEGMTIFNAMQAAERARPPLEFTYKKTLGDDTIFVTAIDGFKNEGGGTGKKNWLFWLNGSFATKSCGAIALDPTDRVVVRFDVFNKGS